MLSQWCCLQTQLWHLRAQISPLETEADEVSLLNAMIEDEHLRKSVRPQVPEKNITNKVKKSAIDYAAVVPKTGPGPGVGGAVGGGGC